jgi:hypothetical protein
MARLFAGLAGLAGLATCVVCLAACGPTPTALSTATPAGAAPTGSAEPTASPTVGPTQSPNMASGWTMLRTERGVDAVHLYDIATFRGALIAIGSSDLAVGSIWSSVDAKAWTSIGDASALKGVSLRSVAVSDSGLVVVGWTETTAVALSSPDGIAWSQHVLPSSHPGSSAISVAWARGRYVAVGGGGEANATVAWTSVDGVAWAALPIVKSGEAVSLSSVAAGPLAYVIDGMELRGPVVWTSSDGMTWTRAALPGSAQDDAGRSRYTGGRFVFSVAGGLWSSTDGRHWAKTVVPGLGVGIFDVAALPGGFVVVGRSTGDNQPGAVAVIDANLSSAIVLPLDPVFQWGVASAVTLSPDGAYVVAVGFQLDGNDVFLFADPAALFNP